MRLLGTPRRQTSAAPPARHTRGAASASRAPLAAGDSSREVRDLLADWRTTAYSRIRDRFERAVEEGDLPAESDPALLARYVATLAFGIAVQAASGVPREDLQQMATAAPASGPLH
ncbi:hypothetical protein [Streptomyces sp. CMB-StM0423]|uniref:hypothetical protein n=1 Tax=Streptomyces sp. CMB-StM0423 TaxID=2059884 RepID=UPI00131D0FFF